MRDEHVVIQKATIFVPDAVVRRGGSHLKPSRIFARGACT